MVNILVCWRASPWCNISEVTENTPLTPLVQAAAELALLRHCSDATGRTGLTRKLNWNGLNWNTIILGTINTQTEICSSGEWNYFCLPGLTDETTTCFHGQHFVRYNPCGCRKPYPSIVERSEAMIKYQYHNSGSFSINCLKLKILNYCRMEIKIIFQPCPVIQVWRPSLQQVPLVPTSTCLINLYYKDGR